MGVKEIKNMEELNTACSQGKPIIIDFGADWCGPSTAADPKFEELSEKYTNVVAVKVNIDNAQDLGAKYDVSGLPAFVVLSKGEMVDALVGTDFDTLEEFFKKYN